jgi:hypothetical protein
MSANIRRLPSDTDKDVCSDMPDLLTPLQTVSSVKSRIVALENAVPTDGIRERNDSQGREGRPLIEIVQKLRSKSIESTKNTELSRSKSTGGEDLSFRKGHKKIDSTAFLEQTYLRSPSTHDLSEDAREILKSQPDEEDLLAVLQYLECGIEKKHDFDIRAPSSKSSQITNTLVSVTVIDHWHRLKRKRISEEEKQLRRCLLSCLKTVTGLGALLAQIKKLSAEAGGEHALTRNMVSVLENILAPNSTISDLMRDTLSTTEKSTLRHVIWQELVSLLAGSKILTVVAESLAKRKIEESVEEPNSWLGDGPRYCSWLAKSIARAATSLHVKETEKWSMLAQISRRGFSLGHRGKPTLNLY